MFIINDLKVLLEVLKSKQIELKITGMSCNHCEMRIKKALEAVEGVKSAKADFRKGNAIVEAEDIVTKDALIKAVNNTGLYKAQ